MWQQVQVQQEPVETDGAVTFSKCEELLHLGLIVGWTKKVPCSPSLWL